MSGIDGNGDLPDHANGECIRIRGARVHNLRNLDVDIPRDRFVVITGPSGSGKSSLAFDTLYAEGQRQYLESLSIHSRQFLHQLERPDVDLIDGLQPTICIDQRAGSRNPRSTVATVTEVYDYLRLLMARLGQPHCWRCGEPIRQQHPEQIVDQLLAMPQGTKLVLLAPKVRGRKGQHQEALAQIRQAGFVRVRVDGEVLELDRVGPLAGRKNHSIEAVIDRLIVRPGLDSRLAESVALALKHGEGTLVASCAVAGTSSNSAAGWHDRLFSTLSACPRCMVSFDELEPRSFSFNSPYGACPDCEGLGARIEFDPDLFLPDESVSLAGGAIAPWKGSSTAAERRQRKELRPLLSAAGMSWDSPLSELTPRLREQLLHGDGKEFLGLVTLLEQDYVTEIDPARQAMLEMYRGAVRCRTCGGSRLRPEARACRFRGRAIHEVTALSISQALAWCGGIVLEGDEKSIAEPIVAEIRKRLDFMCRVGVEYLTLDRSADTLSGGELQRVRLASGIGSGLVGVCYVLDEPSIGLHPRDNGRLIDALRHLQLQGNTVLVVEHDEAVMRAADWLIDMGPGAGRHGGQIVADGTPDDVSRRGVSLTGQYLSGSRSIAVPETRRRVAKSRSISIQGAATNNLKQIDVWLPLSTLVCVTGVSGSGKSSLVIETLAPAVARRLGQAGPKPGPHGALRGVSQIDKLVLIDQTALGRSPRSNPATYTGLFDEIRKVFSGTRQARQLGFTASRFSFNAKGGRCEECQGQGVRRIEMNFLPDLIAKCPACEGARFNRQTLEVRYRERSIAQVLDMPVDEACEFFENFPSMTRQLFCLRDVGLGYLSLGQSSTTLSGGEAQRIRLATELARVDTGRTLYILDEPTTGLHADDIGRLLGVLGRLVDLGNTVVVIEHNLDVIKSADWIIDLGPEGGEAGGYLLAAGTPEQVAAVDGNATGAYLQRVLATAESSEGGRRKAGGSAGVV